MAKFNDKTPLYTNNFEEREELLKKMDSIIGSLDNEEYYYCWIQYVPDCPKEEDYYQIATDEELWNDTVQAFFLIMCEVHKEHYKK